MKSITEKNLTQFPQTEAIPQPLEIHPSVDPELARGLIAAVEYIEDHPHELNMTQISFENAEKQGCIICHVERLSAWRRPDILNQRSSDQSFALGDYNRIYWPNKWTEAGFVGAYHNKEGRMARVEHFLRTGE